MILFLESETPVDICMIQLYMHVMATANDDMLKSQVQVKCQCMQLFTLIYIYIYGMWVRSNPTRIEIFA